MLFLMLQFFFFLHVLTTFLKSIFLKVHFKNVLKLKNLIKFT
jgi:hypothetical protein